MPRADLDDVARVLGDYSRRGVPLDALLADFDFPTWRVTARPYDWAFDGGLPRQPIGVALHGAAAGSVVEVDLATGVPWLLGQRADASVLADAVAFQRGYTLPGAYTGSHVEVTDGRRTIGEDEVLRRRWGL